MFVGHMANILPIYSNMNTGSVIIQLVPFARMIDDLQIYLYIVHLSVDDQATTSFIEVYLIQ